VRVQHQHGSEREGDQRDLVAEAPGDGHGFRAADGTGWLILVEPTLATGPFV
jgi:hypothetical protein